MPTRGASETGMYVNSPEEIRAQLEAARVAIAGQLRHDFVCVDPFGFIVSAGTWDARHLDSPVA